jgi:hypothetical protein
VQLAHDMYCTLIGPKGPVNVSFIDFGCGIDGLFEAEMAQLMSTREDSGKVTALAVDVVELCSAAQLTSDGAHPRDGIDNKHTSFVCKTLAADYSDHVAVKERYMANFDPPSEFSPFDAGVFCLFNGSRLALARTNFCFDASEACWPDLHCSGFVEVWHPL